MPYKEINQKKSRIFFTAFSKVEFSFVLRFAIFFKCRFMCKNFRFIIIEKRAINFIFSRKWRLKIFVEICLK